MPTIDNIGAIRFVWLGLASESYPNLPTRSPPRRCVYRSSICMVLWSVIVVASGTRYHTAQQIWRSHRPVCTDCATSRRSYRLPYG